MFPGLFHAPWLLVGLASLLVPLLIHLLNRRRYDVVEWGAMQFLKVSQTTRRRWFLEELLLMLVRMGLLVALVVGLAGPFLDVDVPASLAGRPARDVVLVIDGSASMAASAEAGSTPARQAIDWVRRHLDAMQPGDTVALLLARETALPLTGSLSVDAQRARGLLAKVPEPGGTCNWAEALRSAFALLRAGQNARREVVLLSDNQRFGLADSESLFRWELLASELGLMRADSKVVVRFVDLAGERGAALPNYALDPLESNRPIATVGREVRFRGALVLSGQDQYVPPHRARLEVNGRPVRELPMPPAGAAVPATGRVPFEFAYSFPEAGSHLISVIVEPDPPREDWPAGYVPRDRVPGDNRQDFSVDVREALPVLLVDGEPSRAGALSLGTDYLRDALAPTRDLSPSVKLQIVTVSNLTPELLTAGPLVVVLHNVGQLGPEQHEGLMAYLARGGGVLVCPGDRCDVAWYNDRAYRDGEGWLPARLVGMGGDETKPGGAARLDAATFRHPALEFFRRFRDSGLEQARFPRWWQLATPGKQGRATFAGLLNVPTGTTPFLVERPYQAGQVMLAAVPFDGSWGSNLTALPAFVPLVHELIHYLAGARSADFNLAPGQPIRFPLAGGHEVSDYALAAPGGPPRPLTTGAARPDAVSVQKVDRPEGALVVFDGARESGIYTLHRPDGKKTYYVIPSDPREADLTPLSDSDRENVRQRAGIVFSADEEHEGQEDGLVTVRQDLWLYVLLGMIGLLCVEVWLTRRMAMNQ